MTNKIFYIFKDPLGSIDSKIGITGNPGARLGNYQNSYSRKSHVACFDVVYYGPADAINDLEKAVKQRFDWDIERDGRGHSEWVSQTYTDISSEVDELIKGYRFKVKKLSKKYLPLTVDNLSKLEEFGKTDS
jgi:hypothetical protein